MYSNAIEILSGVWLGNISASTDEFFLTDRMIQSQINCTGWQDNQTTSRLIKKKYHHL